MNTCVNLWKNLAKFFLEREMFGIEVVEKIKAQIFFQ